MTGRFERRNPVTGAVASRSVAMAPADAAAVADRAAAAFPEWAEAGPSARRALLTRAADALAARSDAFVDAMIDEIGATAAWATFNVAAAVGKVREAAALTPRSVAR